MFKELFIQAFKLWQNRSVNERPKHGSQTYDFFMDHFQPFISQQITEFGFNNLIVQANVGKGAWAEIPWIGIRNPEITKSFAEGLYVAYLLSPDSGNYYLALIQGVSFTAYNEIEKNSRKLQEAIMQPNGFSIGIEGVLSKKFKPYSTPDKYQKAIVYSKKYSIVSKTDDPLLWKDLCDLLKVYTTVACKKT